MRLFLRLLQMVYFAQTHQRKVVCRVLDSAGPIAKLDVCPVNEHSTALLELCPDQKFPLPGNGSFFDKTLFSPDFLGLARQISSSTAIDVCLPYHQYQITYSEEQADQNDNFPDLNLLSPPPREDDDVC